MMKVFNDKGAVRVTLDGAVGQGWFDNGITLDSIRSLVNDDTERVLIDLRSMGGDTFEAFAMYDYLKGLTVPVTVNIVGATASAGTLIAMAADERTITENSKFLIHNNWTATVGDSVEHKKNADALERFDRDAVNIYHKATGMNKSEIRSLMKEERWLDAVEAKEKGFVHRIINVKNKIEMEENNKKIEDLTKQVNDMQATIKNMSEELAVKDQIIDNYEKQRVQDAVKTLESDGKVTDENRESVVNMLTKDFDGTMKVLGSIKVARAIDPEQYIDKDGAVKKDYDWYVKNDTASLIRMYKENPTRYQALVDDKRKKRGV